MKAKQSIPRIRSVRFKSGGHVRLLESPRASVSRDLLASMHESVAHYAQGLDGRIAGYALVVWGADGTLGATVRNEHTSPYTAPALPCLAAEEIRAAYNNDQINRALGLPNDLS